LYQNQLSIPWVIPFIDVTVVNDLAKVMDENLLLVSSLKKRKEEEEYDNDNDNEDDNHNTVCDEYSNSNSYSNSYSYRPIGLNRRWRIYKYQPGGEEGFAPHIDAGFPPSALCKNEMSLVWDATSVIDDDTDTDDDTNTDTDTDITLDSRYPKDTISRLTVLIYLNGDFLGGETKFYSPLIMNENGDSSISSPSSSSSSSVIAAVKPEAGSVLLFPQAVGEEAVDYARKYWPLHEGSPVLSTSTTTTDEDGSCRKNRAKYVIRSDVLFTKVK